MRIIPVIDLLAGSVVRGVGGRREEYRPIQSRFAADAAPRTIARALAREFGFREVYVADLDAIAGGPPAWDSYRDIAAAVPRLLVDAGIRDVDRASSFEDFGPNIAGIIVGLESLASAERLRDLVSVIEPQRLFFSLDLKAGRPITRCPAWADHSAEQIAEVAIELGVRRFIVLDLARVGLGDGVGTEPICRHLRRASSQLEIIAGGGVRNIGDIESLAAAGCDAALVASALHDGRITPDQVRRIHDAL